MASSPPHISQGAIALLKLTEVTKWQSAAALASSIIIASGRPYSIQQALDIARDIQHAMFPIPNDPSYQEWEKSKHARLNKIHGAS